MGPLTNTSLNNVLSLCCAGGVFPSCQLCLLYLPGRTLHATCRVLSWTLHSLMFYALPCTSLGKGALGASATPHRGKKCLWSMLQSLHDKHLLTCPPKPFSHNLRTTILLLLAVEPGLGSHR